VSKSHRPRVADMMKWLHEETGLQFVIVTHEEEYLSVADTVTKITQSNGKTRVQVLAGRDAPQEQAEKTEKAKPKAKPKPAKKGVKRGSVKRGSRAK